MKMDDFQRGEIEGRSEEDVQRRLSVGSGNDQVDLYYFGVGHTNGDTFVVFPAVGTLHTGDMFAWKALPVHRRLEWRQRHRSCLRRLRRRSRTIRNIDTVITGHTPVLRWNDLREYADFNKEFVAWAQGPDRSREDRRAGQPAQYRVPVKYKGYAASPNPQFGGPETESRDYLQRAQEIRPNYKTGEGVFVLLFAFSSRSSRHRVLVRTSSETPAGSVVPGGSSSRRRVNCRPRPGARRSRCRSVR